MLTSPKLIEPLQMARAMRISFCSTSLHRAGRLPAFPTCCAGVGGKSTRVSAATCVSARRQALREALREALRQERPGDQIGAEGGQDRQVEQARGGHDGRVLALLQGGPG